jgi:hypothetical protein
MPFLWPSFVFIREILDFLKFPKMIKLEFFFQEFNFFKIFIIELIELRSSTTPKIKVEREQPSI